MKICSKCKTGKPITSFHKDKRTTDGCYSACRVCHNKYKRVGYYSRLRKEKKENPSPSTVARLAMLGMRSRTNARTAKPCYKEVSVTLNLEELESFFSVNWKEYKKMHREYERSGFSRKYVPSIDRIDPKQGYSIDNIQILPFYANAKRSQKGRTFTPEHKRKLRDARIKYCQAQKDL